ncbi:uncharacterized protein B0J16DRAFT_395699 [Fusarium flagelliforme]|uniref:uncharacterized protein n=1 Tax=Fusarium flagelliforme TaxID=2675880 RepID=UPI001E8E2DCC|nr:uncharacterized protein B0J16DRAFT_395699 [Fusarium flagelliforme]KAH7193773.1 hypothetical protein B0J16DRAFT_395699 [Fusarium flagelliforme]
MAATVEQLNQEAGAIPSGDPPDEPSHRSSDISNTFAESYIASRDSEYTRFHPEIRDALLSLKLPAGREIACPSTMKLAFAGHERFLIAIQNVGQAFSGMGNLTKFSISITTRTLRLVENADLAEVTNGRHDLQDTFLDTVDQDERTRSSYPSPSEDSQNVSNDGSHNTAAPGHHSTINCCSISYKIGSVVDSYRAILRNAAH